jgi:hypothetical protein
MPSAQCQMPNVRSDLLMIEQGYMQSAYNPCLYIKDISGRTQEGPSGQLPPTVGEGPSGQLPPTVGEGPSGQLPSNVSDVLL